MPDREKVIKGLEICIPMKYETNEEKECRHEQCPYGKENYKPMNGCFWDLMSDALALLKEQEHKDKMYHALEEDWKRLKALLKEQEAVSITTDYFDGFGNRTSHCPSCNSRLVWHQNKNYCGECGKRIEWEGR